ncbi:hypothetical protein AAC978_16060 [Desulfitobacterium sp. THU1]
MRGDTMKVIMAPVETVTSFDLHGNPALACSLCLRWQSHGR